MSNINIRITYGNAGCGKTQKLVELVQTLRSKNVSYIVLAPTHNALNNIFKRLGSNNIYKEHLKTLHSYFRINYINDNAMLGPVTYYKNIIIDEFSLIHRTIYSNIIRLLSEMNNVTFNIYLFGDPLQLNAVYDNSVDNCASFKDLIKYENDIMNITNNEPSIRMLKHYIQSIFYHLPSAIIKNNVSYSMLAHNYRSNDAVMQILTALRHGDNTFSYTFIPKYNVINKLMQPETYLLASNYEILQSFYDMYARVRYNGNNVKTIVQSSSTADCESHFKALYLYPGCKLRALVTDDNMYNGQILIYESFTNNMLACYDEATSEYICVKKNDEGIYPVGPYNMLTVHKSQGYSLENVIVCYSKMFEVSMLYTAATRAMKTLAFCSYNTKPCTDDLLVNMHYKDLDMLYKISLSYVQNDIQNTSSR